MLLREGVWGLHGTVRDSEGLCGLTVRDWVGLCQKSPGTKGMLDSSSIYRPAVPQGDRALLGSGRGVGGRALLGNGRGVGGREQPDCTQHLDSTLSTCEPSPWNGVVCLRL